MSALDLQADNDFAADWDVWHKQHQDRLAAPDGFLAITSINWLTGNQLPVAVEAGEQIPHEAKSTEA